MSRTIRFLEKMECTILSGHRRVPPFGLAGGEFGQVGENSVRRNDGRIEKLEGCDATVLEAGEAITIRSPTAGGYGAREALGTKPGPMTGSPPRYRLGVDVGGTHTDLVLFDTATGKLLVEKVSSTPKNPALGVLDGIARFISRGIPPGEIGFFAHGTTITTNALLEMRGAKVGLLITKGYRAVQEVQNQARDGNLFDYFYQKPQPIAPQSLTKEIPERTDYAGNVLQPLDREAVREAARALNAAGVESIAVCYLFSFMNPAHEEETRALVHEEFPGVHISLSSEVLPRIREWARLSTTLLNAYLEPVLVDYISHLNQGLDHSGIETKRRFLMQSNGGVMPFSAAMAGGRTVHTLFSGPAAGAQASAYLAEADARSGLVTLDMGGTSADIAFIEGGIPLETTEGVIARRQIDVPALDMTSISAGGGSIAWIDNGGFLNVGPQSSGADPGPACYGRGGHPAPRRYPHGRRGARVRGKAGR